MILDIRTIVFSYVLTDIVCLAVVILLWFQHRKRFAGTDLWIIDYALQFAALFLIVLRGMIPGWASIVLPNALVMIGAFFGYLALLDFAGARRNQMFNYFFLACNIAAHVYFTNVSPSVEGRSFNTSVGLLVIAGQCAWYALAGAPAALRPIMRWIGSVFSLYCIISLLRIGHYFILDAHRVDFFAPSAFDASIMVVYQILFVALTFSIVLMYNQGLVADIRAGEDKFAKAFRSSPYALTISRLYDGAMIEINDGFVQISGYDYDEIIGKTSIDLNLWVCDEDRKAVVRETAEKGHFPGREMIFRRKSGELLTGFFSAERITINSQDCILSSIDDITVRKKMESAQRQSETMLRMVLDNLPIGIAVNSIDPTVNFSYVNDNFVQCYRISRESIAVPDGFWEAVYKDPVAREKMKRKVLADCASNDPNRMHWDNIPVTRRGEPTTFVSARNIPLPGESLMISTVWDITAQIRADQEIHRLNAELEQRVRERTDQLANTQMALLNLVDDLNQSARDITSANQSLETVNKELAAFSYSVSHDLRAPLRSIDGFSSALLEDYGDQLGSEGKNYLDRIRRATQTMGQLIDDLLNLSRVTQAEFYRQDFDLSAMVREIADAQQQRNYLNDVILDIQDGVIVRADQRLIHIVMTNLLDNAWKFSSKTGNPRIAFGATEEKGETAFFVQDNGAGFDMNYVGKLFGAFQRLHRAEEFPGTGIGLATVARVINRHGGRIWAESKPGNGATFFFTLGG